MAIQMTFASTRKRMKFYVPHVVSGKFSYRVPKGCGVFAREPFLTIQSLNCDKDVLDMKDFEKWKSRVF